MKNFVSPRISKSLALIKWGVAFLLLYLIVEHVHSKEIAGALSQLTWTTFTLLMLISVLLVYISALKWSYFLAHFGLKVSVVSLTNLYCVGYFINLAFPSTLGGDALRSWYVGKKTDHHQALASTILERYTGFAAMILMASMGCLVTSIISMQAKCAVLLTLVGLIVGTVMALSPAMATLVTRCPGGTLVGPHFEKIQKALRFASHKPKLLLKAFLLSFMYHSFAVANVVAAAWAVGWNNPPVADLFVATPIALLIGSLPITPSGLGIQEGAFYFLLTQVGASPGEALGVGVLLRAKTYILALVGGLGWIYVKRSGGVVLREG